VLQLSHRATVKWAVFCLALGCLSDWILTLGFFVVLISSFRSISSLPVILLLDTENSPYSQAKRTLKVGSVGENYLKVNMVVCVTFCVTYLYRCTVHFVESLNQHTNQCTYITFFYIKTFKIAPTCFDPKLIFRELHCSLLKSHFFKNTHWLISLY